MTLFEARKSAFGCDPCFLPNYWYISEFAVSLALQRGGGGPIVAAWHSQDSHAAAALVVRHLPR
jgi:hypothetical protein